MWIVDSSKIRNVYKVNLQARLQLLVGHDFMTHMANDPFDDEDYPVPNVPQGRLQEVGEGYAIIETKSEEEGGFVGIGSEWIIALRYVTVMLHTIDDCAGCTVDAANKVKGTK